MIAYFLEKKGMRRKISCKNTKISLLETLEADLGKLGMTFSTDIQIK